MPSHEQNQNTTDNSSVDAVDLSSSLKPDVSKGTSALRGFVTFFLILYATSRSLGAFAEASKKNLSTDAQPSFKALEGISQVTTLGLGLGVGSELAHAGLGATFKLDRKTINESFVSILSLTFAYFTFVSAVQGLSSFDAPEKFGPFDLRGSVGACAASSVCASLELIARNKWSAAEFFKEVAAPVVGFLVFVNLNQLGVEYAAVSASAGAVSSELVKFAVVCNRRGEVEANATAAAYVQLEHENDVLGNSNSNV